MPSKYCRMGDKVLKSHHFLLTILFYTNILWSAQATLSLGNEVKVYDQIFEKISEKRIGADISRIDRTENPFIMLRSDDENTNTDGNVTTENQSALILEATLEQKAKINGIWYKKNNTIGRFKLIKIEHNRVVLSNEIETKELYIKVKDDSNFKLSYQ